MGETSGNPSPAAVSEEGELSNDSDFSHLFVVDSTPADAERNADVPVYEKKFSEVLHVQPKVTNNERAKPPKPFQNTCWNCSGNHNLMECTERRNPETISRNRQIFMSKQANRGPKANRYHLDAEQKYDNFQPGKISRRLQRALGLQSNQLPRHIYRMRVLGYPPGWVEDARVSHSGLSLFDSDGQEVADPGFEDGEIVAVGAKDKYDIKKIKEYPGFNCPCNPDVIDEAERLNSKPMSEKDSIERMVTVWQPKAVKAYKRKKMIPCERAEGPNSSRNSSDKKNSLLLLDDMELNSDTSSSDEEDGEISNDKAEVPQCSMVTSPNPQGVKRSASPTVDSPGIKKQRIGNDEDDNSQESQDSKESKECFSPPADKSKADSPCRAATPDIKKEAQSTPNVGKVTSVSLGTPVIVTSPFTCLPSPDKFSKNICDVINFENLPDSTGKYEKMSGLIKKVRSFVTKLNAEDDDDD